MLLDGIRGRLTDSLIGFGRRSCRWIIRRVMSNGVHYDEVDGCLKAFNTLPMDMMSALFLFLFPLAISEWST